MGRDVPAYAAVGGGVAALFEDGAGLVDCEGYGVGLGGDADVGGCEVDEVEDGVGGCCECGQEGEGFVGEHFDHGR